MTVHAGRYLSGEDFRRRIGAALRVVRFALLLVRSMPPDTPGSAALAALAALDEANRRLTDPEIRGSYEDPVCQHALAVMWPKVRSRAERQVTGSTALQVLTSVEAQFVAIAEHPLWHLEFLGAGPVPK